MLIRSKMHLLPLLLALPLLAVAQDCIDFNGNCLVWAARGLCNGDFVPRVCSKSCKVCEEAPAQPSMWDAPYDVIPTVQKNSAAGTGPVPYAEIANGPTGRRGPQPYAIPYASQRQAPVPYAVVAPGRGQLIVPYARIYGGSSPVARRKLGSQNEIVDSVLENAAQPTEQAPITPPAGNIELLYTQKFYMEAPAWAFPLGFQGMPAQN